MQQLSSCLWHFSLLGAQTAGDDEGTFLRSRHAVRTQYCVGVIYLDKRPTRCVEHETVCSFPILETRESTSFQSYRRRLHGTIRQPSTHCRSLCRIQRGYPPEVPTLHVHRLHPLHEWGIEGCILGLGSPGFSLHPGYSQQRNALRN